MPPTLNVGEDGKLPRVKPVSASLDFNNGLKPTLSGIGGGGAANEVATEPCVLASWPVGAGANSQFPKLPLSA